MNPRAIDGLTQPFNKETIMSNAKFEKAKKSLRGWGGTVIFFAVLSLTGLEDADEGLVAFSIFSIIICVIAGIWLLAKPSFKSGLAAGGSLILLTIVDGTLSADGSGSPFYVIIDIFAAVMVFASLAQFQKASKLPPDEITEPEKSGQSETETVKVASDKNKAKAVLTLLNPGYLAGVVSIQFVLDEQTLSTIQFGETREYEIEPGSHKAKIVLQGIMTRTSKELSFTVEKGQTVNIQGKYSRAWGNIKLSLV